MKYLFLSVIAILFLACQQPAKKFAKSDATKQVQAKPIDSETVKLQKLYLEDSLYVASLLAKALTYAQGRAGDADYTRSLNDSSVLLKFGNLFADGQKYLVMERTPRGFITNIDLFIWTGSKFKLLKNINAEEMSFSYIGYQLRDVNGDGKKDFLVNVYPSSGCCRRDVYWVYLYQKEGSFSARYEFLNPTFFPAEKIIRGVNYGHPGEVPLYKYKWNGNKVDTIEFIYRADTLAKKFYRVRNYGDESDARSRQTLNRLPTEYLKIESIEWFMDNE